MSVAAAAVTDGRGSERVVDEIEAILGRGSGSEMSETSGAVSLRPMRDGRCRPHPRLAEPP